MNGSLINYFRTVNNSFYESTAEPEAVTREIV